eukprot:m.754205 g.754205  ORF g.754205 m.754205 type:complete len:57 (+) comp58998_c0_seq19:1119-1289(+)
MVCVTRTQRVPWSAAVGSHTSCAQGPTFTRTSPDQRLDEVTAADAVELARLASKLG